MPPEHLKQQNNHDQSSVHSLLQPSDKTYHQRVFWLHSLKAPHYSFSVCCVVLRPSLTAQREEALQSPLKPPVWPLWISVQHQYLISTYVILKIAKGEGYTESRQLLCLLFFCLAFDLQAEWGLLPLKTADLCFELCQKGEEEKKKRRRNRDNAFGEHI